MADKHVQGLKYPIRIKVFDEDAIHDIHTYEINNSKENKFISSNKDMEFCIKDMQYVIIYGSEFEKIVDDISKNAVEEYKKSLKKVPKSTIEDTE